MNEFTAKKLGEVLAFSDVALDTINRGREAFEKGFGSETVENFEKEMKLQKDTIHTLADRANQLTTVITKLESTGEKLKKMRDLYVGDQWDNPIELLEWSGFFEGAAIVHWSLVEGASSGIAHSEMEALARQGVESHKEMFRIATEKLKQVGLDRSTQ
jgi:hypothetical protein